MRKQLRKLHSAHGRKKAGLSVCEGIRSSRELLSARPDLVRFAFFDETALHGDIEDIYSSCKGVNIPCEPLPTPEFNRNAFTEHPQGVMLVFDIPLHNDEHQPQLRDAGDPFILVLDQVQDPGNIGTILRTARAVGLSGVWLAAGTVDPFSPKAVRAGMGGQFGLTVSQFQDWNNFISALVSHGYHKLWVTVPDGGYSCFNREFGLTGSALVLGNEAHGVSMPPSAESQHVHIPMPGGAESLNVAQAATVLLFEAVRREVLPANIES